MAKIYQIEDKEAAKYGVSYIRLVPPEYEVGVTACTLVAGGKLVFDFDAHGELCGIEILDNELAKGIAENREELLKGGVDAAK